MKNPLRFPIFLVTLLAGFAQAATTLVGLETDYTGPPSTSINTSVSQSRNLSNLAGLTPGQTIQLQFIPDDPMTWDGSLFYPAGDLLLTWTGIIEISVGGHLLTYTDTWSLEALNAPEGGPGGVFGYDVPGPAPVLRTLDLPWGTDLSNVTITLRDLSTFSGGDFHASSLQLSGTLRTVSVPEPSAILLSIILPAVMLGRRRRNA
ncbi:hypothetical protein [Luteolibacter sp. Populi]|uniref:hypothetical protein n=1 Tax=Luteolibacter sp. Populi TaxID=3230487 RepID=UPI003465B080